jgi:anti-sigma regulatory factor (Ser/Thr protein kinase)
MEELMRLNPVRLPVLEKTQASEARRIASEIARSLRFTETQVGQVAIAVTEAGNNLALHARQGELLLSTTHDFRGPALEILSIDRGPGMDVERCLSDGHSTAGTSGTGLGAIERLAAVFDVFSDASGTVLFARFEQDPAINPSVSIGAARAAKPGETHCGDSWSVRQTPVGFALLVADGLGHGEFAADAAEQAVKIFQEREWYSVTRSVEDLHAGLKGTRGAAVAVASLDEGAPALHFCGMGNIAGAVARPEGIQRLVSHNGTAGHSAMKIGAFHYKWEATSTLILHSDGISSHWDLHRYPRLLRHHPAVIAGALYRDFCRGRDDATVVVLRQS